MNIIWFLEGLWYGRKFQKLYIQWDLACFFEEALTPTNTLGFKNGANLWQDHPIEASLSSLPWENMTSLEG